MAANNKDDSVQEGLHGKAQTASEVCGPYGNESVVSESAGFQQLDQTRTGKQSSVSEIHVS